MFSGRDVSMFPAHKHTLLRLMYCFETQQLHIVYFYGVIDTSLHSSPLRTWQEDGMSVVILKVL